MHKSLVEYLTTTKAIVSSQSLKHAKKREIASDLWEGQTQNTIFNQSNHINLSKFEIEQIQITLTQLEQAQQHIVGAMAAIKGFQGLNTKPLVTAGNFLMATSHMLEELMRQQSGMPIDRNMNFGRWAGKQS